MTSYHKIVVKVGTSTLTQGTKKLSRAYMLGLVQQIAHLHQKGKQIILVSSGAIAAGREQLRHLSIDQSVATKQMFAAVGQVQLMHAWTELFSLFEIHVGQVLLTRADVSHRKRYLNARDTLTCLLDHHIVPIINENDTVATQEIRVGDNDNLAALAANLIGADLLILLTDQEGLYTADPRHNPTAQLIPVVKKIDASVFDLAGGVSSTLGTGGMITKIEAAQVAVHCGTPTIIASSSQPNVLVNLVEGAALGTFFQADITPRESRKRWLLSEKKQGVIVVDDGAASRIAHHGASLLPSGITQSSGEFDRGAIVHILSPEGHPIAAGMTNYSHVEIQRLIGLHSTGIEQVLGYNYGQEIVHRNNMARIKHQEEQ